jgi:hypothetical protein
VPGLVNRVGTLSSTTAGEEVMVSTAMGLTSLSLRG